VVTAISPALVFVRGALGIGLGTFVAFLLVRRSVSLAPLAIPVVSLLITLRPLFLMMVAGVVVGLVTLGGLVLLAGAGLLSFVALWALVLPERDQLRRAGAWDQPLVDEARTVLALGETDKPGARTTTERAVPAEEAKPPPAPSSYADDRALAAAYAPVLALTRDERWSPIAYDEWETHVFAGKLVQRHEGDWEAVTIGLSDTDPLFVAYSAHCAGTWVPWEEAELSDRLGGRAHPLVAVAEGSHANYPRADQKRSPDWAGCQGAPEGTTTLLSYASNIRDKTEYGWEWYPEESGIHVVSETEAPMSFPGYWGAGESTTLYGFFKKTALGNGHAPETPSEQPLWRTPVTKIFCGNYSRTRLRSRAGSSNSPGAAWATSPSPTSSGATSRPTPRRCPTSATTSTTSSSVSPTRSASALAARPRCGRCTATGC